VRRPGLYRLRQGSRIADAVARAGGATAKADLAQVNLAAPLADGEQVVVPRRGAPGAVGGGSSTGAPAGPVQLSTATLEQLDTLPGVGPSTAQKILDYREKHGAFSSVDELDAVPGIGPKRLEQLRELVVPLPSLRTDTRPHSASGSELPTSSEGLRPSPSPPPRCSWRAPRRPATTTGRTRSSRCS
jgi:comEA protein